jgi:cysteinyl-tRNA synthetase
VSEANRRFDAGDRVGLGRLPEMLYALGLEGLLEAGDGGANPRAEALLTEREQARAARDFDRADAIRSELEGMGYEVRDGPDGPRLVPLR